MPFLCGFLLSTDVLIAPLMSLSPYWCHCHLFNAPPVTPFDVPVCPPCWSPETGRAIHTSPSPGSPLCCTSKPSSSSPKFSKKGVCGEKNASLGCDEDHRSLWEHTTPLGDMGPQCPTQHKDPKIRENTSKRGQMGAHGEGRERGKVLSPHNVPK